MRCNACKKGYHQKCSTGPKASTRDDLWKCEKYTKLRQTRLTTPSDCHLPEPTNSTRSQPLLGAVLNKLKIYHWDADGICPKSVELRDRLINSYIDVRKDRNNILGGGLLLFIRTDIVFEKLHSFEKAGMEILSIHLKTTKSS